MGDVGVEGVCETYLPSARPRSAADERPVLSGGGYEVGSARSSTGRVGLLNEGATCYLNSLLQALFYTPPFREALFAWRRQADQDDGKEEGWEEEEKKKRDLCIPSQLQLLFARLACSERGAVGTKALTTSFRWTQAESFRQHDIQELMRVLFSAIERSLPGAPGLYRGTLVDYIACSECGFRREHTEEFFDVSLVVRGHRSAEEALRQYVEPETLDGDNMWRCGGCDRKVRAEKGLRFRRLPEVLAVQLKRFCYDPFGGGRVKINDEVAFGERLSVDAQDGAREYGLFAVLMHSGTANGGHYFAYVRTGGRWLEYNDATVSELPGDDPLRAAYGGDRGGGSGASAYMLMYRAASGAAAAHDWDSLPVAPADLAAEVGAEDDVWRAERDRLERERRMLDVAVMWRNKEHRFRFDLGETLAAVKGAVLAGLEGHAPPAAADARLRVWDAGIGFARETFTGREHLPIGELGFRRSNSLVLEARAAGEDFAAYDPDSVPLRLKRVRPETVSRCVQESELGLGGAASDDDPDLFVACVSRFVTVAGLAREAERIGAGVPAGRQRLVLLLDDRAAVLRPGDTLEEAGVPAGARVHVEDTADDGGDGGGSPLARHFEDMRCQITVEFNHPDEDPGPADPKYCYNVRLSKHSTLAALKLLVAPVLNVPAGDFRLRRSAGGKQFKDEEQTLARAGVGDRSVVFVERGRPLGKDEVELELLLYRPEAAAARDRFERLARLPFDRTAPVSRLKTEMLEAVRTARPGMDARHVRLREVKKGKAGRIFQDSASLARSVPSLRDGHEVAVQLLDEPETMASGDRVVFLQRWLPEKAALRRPREVVVRKSETVGGLRRTVAALPGNDDLEAADVGVARAPAVGRLTKAKAAALKFRHPKVTDELPLRMMPLNVHDGDTLVYQDNRAEPAPEIVAARAEAARGRAARGRGRGGRGRGRGRGGVGGGGDVVRMPARRTEHALRIYSEEERPAEGKQ